MSTVKSCINTFEALQVIIQLSPVIILNVTEVSLSEKKIASHKDQMEWKEIKSIQSKFVSKPESKM